MAKENNSINKISRQNELSGLNICGKLFIAVLFGACGTLFGENLVRDGDFSKVKNGKPIYWHFSGDCEYDKSEGCVTFRNPADQKPVRMSRLSQKLGKVTVKKISPSEKYHLSVKLKTTNLTYRKVFLVLSNKGWTKYAGVYKFPADTAGKWREISADVVAPPSEEGYSVGIFLRDWNGEVSVKDISLTPFGNTEETVHKPGENVYTGDTSAEAQPYTLTRGYYSSSVVPWTWDDTQAFDGKKSIRVDWDAKSHFITSPPVEPVWSFLRHLSVMDSPDLQIGQKYAFSFYAKASSDNYPLTVHLVPSAGYRCRAAGGVSRKTIYLSSEWKRYWLTLVPRVKAGALLTSYSAVFNFQNSPAGTVWYDAVQMEKGETPTPYKNHSPMNVGVLLNSSDWCNVYFPDEPVIATLNVDMPPGKAYLYCKVVDYKGRIVKEFKKAVNGSEKIKLPLSERLGWFKITAELIAGNAKTMSTDSINYLKIQKPVKTAPGLQPFAGFVDNCGYYNNLFEIEKKLGAKRRQYRAFWKASIPGGIEVAPEKFNWKEFEWELKQGKKFGMLNKVSVNLFDVPDWYFDKDELAAAKKVNNYNAFLVLDKSKHDSWRKFIGEITRRYGNLIDEFELGAEDNGRLGFNHYYQKLYPEEVKKGYLVGGKPFDDLCAMVKIGIEEIRKTHPDIKIGAIRPSRSGTFHDLLFIKAMLRKIGKDFDIFPADYYFYPFDFGPAKMDKRAKSDGFIPLYNATKKALAEFGNGQPIYMSEFGWAVDIRFPDDSIYRQEQAETMPKDFIVARVAGFYAFDWYMGFRSPGIRQYSFPLAQGMKIQSIAAAYSAAARVVENVTASTWLTPDRFTRIAVMHKYNGKGVAAVWSDQGHKLSFPSMDKAKMTDVMGNPIPPPTDWLTLSPAPIYIWSDNFKHLNEALSKAKVEMTEFCNIKFRMLTADTGQVLFVNNSNNSDFEIDATINVGGKNIKRTVEVPKGSSNTCDIPLSGGTIEVKAGIPGKTVVEKSFTIPAHVPIAAGSKPDTLIAEAVSRDDVIPGDPWVPWTGPDDLSCKIFSSWDAENLYIKVAVKDDLHFNEFPKTPWKADSLQIGIDPENNGAFGDKRGPDDFEFCFGLGDDGKAHCIFSHGKDICRPANYTITRDEKTKTTNYSLYLAWKDLGVKPKAGMVLGMSFVIFDDDSGSGKNYHMPIGGGIAGGRKDPALYKKFFLK